MWLHRRMRHFIRDIPRLSYIIGFYKTSLGIAEHVVIFLFNVVRLVFVDQVRLGLHRLFWIEPRRQQLVLHVDQLQRLLRRRLAHRCHARNVVADIPHLVDDQRVLIMSNRKYAVGSRRVLTGDDCHHAFNRERTPQIDLANAGMRIRRMQNLSHQHPRQAQIVCILSAARRFLRRIYQRDRLANDRELTHGVLFRRRQALALGIHCILHRLIHLLVSGATAQIPAERLPNLVLHSDRNYSPANVSRS